MANLIQQKQIEGLDGGALTPTNHRSLRQLVHNIKAAQSSCFEERLRDSKKRLTNIIIWTDNTKVQKILEIIYARDLGGSTFPMTFPLTFAGNANFIQQITVKLWDELGVLFETLTGTITRDADQFIQTIDWGRT